MHQGHVTNAGDGACLMADDGSPKKTVSVRGPPAVRVRVGRRGRPGVAGLVPADVLMTEHDASLVEDDVTLSSFGLDHDTKLTSQWCHGSSAIRQRSRSEEHTSELQ